MTSHDDRRTNDNANVATLRGASPVGVGRRFWTIVVTLGLAIFAVVLVVSFVSAAHDNARVERLKSHGIPVEASIDTCVGNLGGSGSNASSFTCRASYVVTGTTYHEVVGLMNSFASPGTHVAVVADPSRPSTIELASGVASSRASDRVYLVPSALSIVWIVLGASVITLRRRTTSRDL